MAYFDDFLIDPRVQKFDVKKHPAIEFHAASCCAVEVGITGGDAEYVDFKVNGTNQAIRLPPKRTAFVSGIVSVHAQEGKSTTLYYRPA